jgi:F0F1-type ATP synthase membrane subunit b/b'
MRFGTRSGRLFPISAGNGVGSERLIEAQSRETISQLRADVIELRTALREEVVARLAAVRDGEDGEDGA